MYVPWYVLSRWHNAASPLPLKELRITNMLDLEASDVLLALTHQELGRETYVEIGFHLSRKKPVLWFPSEKERPCLSLETHPLVQRFETVEQVLQGLRLIVSSCF